MKLRKLLLVSSLALAVAAFSPAAAQAATQSTAAGHAVPFTGTFRGTETTQSLVFPVLTRLGNWTGVATHLGRFTAENHLTINVTTSAGNGTLVLIAANGDTVTADESGQAAPFGTSGTLFIVEHATITGGTGRFAGATGSFTIKRLSSPTSSPATTAIVGFFAGTISSSAAGDD